MKQKEKQAFFKKIFFIARVCACAKYFFLFLLLGADSNGLIGAVEKQRAVVRSVDVDGKRNDALFRWKKNRELAVKKTLDTENTLIAALQNDSSAIVRQGAAQQLGNYGQNRFAVRALADGLLNDADKSVRYACALSLGISPTFKAITALERAMNDPDPDLRRQIAFSLNRHAKGPNAVRAGILLKKMRRDADSSVREMAGGKP